MAQVPTPTVANRVIADKVRDRMSRAGIGEAQLSEDALIARTTLRRRLSGRSTWTTDELIATARVQGVTLLDLLPGEDVA